MWHRANGMGKFGAVALFGVPHVMQDQCRKVRRVARERVQKMYLGSCMLFASIGLLCQSDTCLS